MKSIQGVKGSSVVEPAYSFIIFTWSWQPLAEPTYEIGGFDICGIYAYTKGIVKNLVFGSTYV